MENRILSDFEKAVEVHSLCPGDNNYNGNAFAGEAGEVCNILKKIHMARTKPEWVEQDTNPLQTEAEFNKRLADEIGDALFYLKRIASDNGITFGYAMKLQIIKLADQSNLYQRNFLK